MTKPAHFKALAIPLDKIAELLRVPDDSVIAVCGIDPRQYVLQVQVHHPSFEEVPEFEVVQDNIPDHLWKESP